MATKRPGPRVQRKLDWTSDRLKQESEPSAGATLKGFGLVLQMLDEYHKLQKRSGDGPHLMVALSRVSTAAERCAGNGLERTKSQENALLVFKAAEDERQRINPERNPLIPKDLSVPKVLKTGATMTVVKGAVIAKIVDEKPGPTQTLAASRSVEITREFGGGYWGFMDGPDLFAVSKQRCTGGKAVLEHEVVDIRLFDEEPKATDVKQGKIGDCFLLGPAASMAARDPSLIKEMMQQYPDGTVAVRLFVPSGVPGKKSFAPLFVRVQQSVVKADGTDVFAQKALWPQMLEKAYATSKLGQQEGVAKKTKSEYQNISGGQSQEAMEILLGREVNKEVVEGGTEASEFTYLHQKSMPWSGEEQQAIKKAVGREGSWQESIVYRGLAAKLSQGEAEDQAKKWLAWCGEGSVFMFADVVMVKHERSFVPVMGSEDVEVALKDAQLPATLVDVVGTYIRENHLMPGRIGSGQYTDAQLAAFGRIATALGMGKPVAADTPSIVAVDQTNSGYSANEPKGEGLVGNHSYSVLRVSEEGGVLFLRLRNPWGRYGRSYQRDDKGWTPMAVDDGDGEFDMELTDFLKRFKNVNIPS